MTNEILDEPLNNLNGRRRDLLPLWIKIFLWIFMITGIIVPVGIVIGLLGMEMNLSLYGMETVEPLSLIGLFISLLFAIKGLVSFGLWTGKDWALNLAIVDAVLGIGICIAVMFILPFAAENSGFKFTLRLELVALIPYLVKMHKLKPEWEGITL